MMTRMRTITHPTKGTVTIADDAWTAPGGGPIEHAVADSDADPPERLHALRNAGEAEGHVLLFDQGEWDAFVAGARDGEFDPAVLAQPAPGHQED